MYVVWFTGTNDKPIFCNTKIEAEGIKSEHPNGKFASVIKDNGTAFEGHKHVERRS